MKILADFFCLAGTDAAGANMHADMGSVWSYRLYALNIGFAELFAFVVGMAHFVAAQLAFAAFLTGT